MIKKSRTLRLSELLYQINAWAALLRFAFSAPFGKENRLSLFRKQCTGCPEGCGWEKKQIVFPFLSFIDAFFGLFSLILVYFASTFFVWLRKLLKFVASSFFHIEITAACAGSQRSSSSELQAWKVAIEAVIIGAEYFCQLRAANVFLMAAFSITA